VGALGGCDLPVGSNAESEGLGELQAAREKADAARNLVALDTACCDRTATGCASGCSSHQA
jgi:hypothetical protein